MLSAFSSRFPRGFTAKAVQSISYIDSVGVRRINSKSYIQTFGKFGRAMAASSSAAAPGDLVMDALISSCANVSICAKPSSVYFRHGGVGAGSRQPASISFRSGDAKKNGGNRAYCLLGVVLAGSLVRTSSSSVSACYSSKAVPDVSQDGSGYDELLTSLAISPDQKIPAERPLKLLSGSCYMPHPDKVKTGGEDAHFICVDEQVVGVADGVGGWADVGVNAGDYARELMTNSVNAIRDEPKESIDLTRVLTKAHSETNSRGSSTACIIALKDQFLLAINLGDSGFIVVRDGRTIFESPVQLHGFNFPTQLERGNAGDPPSSCQAFQIPVMAGDVIVVGTDGLFDNLFSHEISSVVGMGIAAGLTPEATANKITALARQRALDKVHQTPFAKAAQGAGFSYLGGKLDDVTVVVSYVTDTNNT